MKIISFWVFALPLFLLSACDKGMSSVNNTMKSYEKIVAGEISLDDAQEAYKAHLTFSILAAAHADKGSGKKAKEIAESIRSKAQKTLDEARPQYEESTRKLTQALIPVEKATDGIQKKIRQQNAKRKYIDRFPFVSGDCIAIEHGQEFDDIPSFREVEINKVEQVGAKSVLIRELYFSPRERKFAADWIQQVNNTKPQEVSQISRKYGLKLDCKLAAEIQQNYQKASEIGADHELLAVKLSTLAQVVGGRLN